jgi:hypothetical protein
MWFILLGAGIALISVVVGAGVMFRGMSVITGRGFLGGVPKGKVFTIPEVDEAQEFPEAERSILEKTSEFLNKFNGGVQ